MVKEGIMLIADDIESLTETSLEMNNCSLEECFPAYANKCVEINGKTYQMSIDVRLKELK